MHLYGIRVFEHREMALRGSRGQAGKRLRAVAAIMLTLAAGVPSGFAQESIKGAGAKGPDKATSVLPPAPAPILT